MTVVTLIAWSAPAVRTVYLRKALLQKILDEGGQTKFYGESRSDIAKHFGSRTLIRYLLGDQAVSKIAYPRSPGPIAYGEWIELRETFPEAASLPVCHSTGTTSLAFSSDGKLLAAGKDLQGPLVADLETGRVLWAENTAACCAVSDQGIAVEFRPNGKELFVGADFISFYAFDAVTGQRKYPTQDPLVNSLGFARFAQSADGNRVLVQTDYEPVTMTEYDTSTWRSLVTCPLDADDGTTCIGFAEDGTQFLVGYSSGNVVVYDAHTGKSLKRFALGEFNYALAFSPDGKWVVTTRNELWEMERRKRWAALPSVADRAEDECDVAFAQFNPRQSHLLTFNESQGALVMEFPALKVLQRFPFSFDDRIEVVTLSFDGRHIATAGRGSGNVCVWDVATGQKNREFPLEADFTRP